MAGFLAYMAAGAAQGVGNQLVEEAKARREERLLELQHNRVVEREDADRSFRRSERLASQEYESVQNKAKLAQEAAAAGTKPPEVKEFFDENGQAYKAQWNPATRSWDKVGGSMVPSDGITITNPDGSSVQVGGGAKKITEQQSKDVVYFTRGADANARLAELDTVLPDWTQTNADILPLGLGNYAKTPSFRQAKQAADGFLAAILRKDTGAAVTPSEFSLYGKMFLPVPGDDAGTIQQKRRAREVALHAIKSGLGTAEAIATANEVFLKSDDSGLTKNPLAEKSPEKKRSVVIDGFEIEQVD